MPTSYRRQSGESRAVSRARILSHPTPAKQILSHCNPARRRCYAPQFRGLQRLGHRTRARQVQSRRTPHLPTHSMQSQLSRPVRLRHLDQRRRRSLRASKVWKAKTDAKVRWTLVFCEASTRRARAVEQTLLLSQLGGNLRRERDDLRVVLGT